MAATDSDTTATGPGDAHPAKRQKMESRGLFKPPTSEELHMLSDGGARDTSFFKLQVEELTKEMLLTSAKVKHVNDGLEKLKNLIMSVKEVEVENLWDTSWLPKDIKLPWRWKGQRTKGAMKMQKPVAIKVAGSFPLGACTKSKLNVDLVVKMPSTVIHAKDYLNFRFHHKSALYLAYLVNHLRGQSDVEELTFTFSKGDPLRPILAVTLKGKSLKRVTFNLHPCPPDGSWRLARFTPVMSNIRSQWYNHSEKEKETFPVTPHYNASVLCTMCMERHLQHMLALSQDFPSFKESHLLLRVWLHQRELDKGPGGFTAFIAGMLISYLLQEKKISKRMHSQQILRNVLHYLSQSDWSKRGIALTPEEGNPGSLPSIDDFHAAFDVVFVDQTGHLNLCAQMTRNTFQQVKYEAACSLRFLNDPLVNSFDLLCMTPVPFSRKYDQLIQIWDLSWVKAYCKKLKLNDSLMERKGLSLLPAIPYILALLEKALGERVRAIEMKPLDIPKWSVDASVVSYSGVKSLTFGLLLNDEYSFNVLEKGPPADSPEAAEFKAFWGDRSEMRRFHDGSICEAVLWPGKTAAEKRLTCCHIVQYVLEKHANIPPKHVTFITNQLDPTIKPAKCLPPKDGASSILPIGTGEEQHLKVFEAYQELSKALRQLKGIPLGISSVQGISAVFRHTEVFPPLPAFKSKGQENSDKTFQVPTVEYPCPEYLPSFKVVCHLEDSGKWPDNVEAIQKIKTAFYISISDILKEQFGLTSTPTERFLDILQGGFVFRIEVAHVKELGILKEGRSKLGHLAVRETEASFELEKRTVALPRLTSALYGVGQEHKSFGLTACLAKRWVAAQLLSDHIPDEAVELLIAHLYLHPEPYAAPRASLVGFQRFLYLLASYDWANKIMVVNLNSELKASDYEEIQQFATNNRSQLPVMCIITPADRSSIWTRDQPTKMILHRLQLLAAESLKCLESQLAENMPLPAFRQIFRPPLEGYDVIIHLNKSLLARRRQAVDADGDATLKIRNVTMETETDTLPVVDFDPVQLYVADLKDAFGDFAMFFHDQYGGSLIGVKWRVPAFEAKPTKVSSMTAAMPDTSSEKILTTVVPNVEGILADFKIIGDTLVDSVEVFHQNWKIK